MDELDQFIDGFYAKYAPQNTPQGEPRTYLREKLTDDFDGYVRQMYAKYAPQNTPSPEQMVTLRQQFLPSQQSQQPLGLGGDVVSAVHRINIGFYNKLTYSPSYLLR